MRLLLRIVLLALLALVLPAAAREEIADFAAEVTLATDGSVTVLETIAVNAEGNEIRRGIYRDIPMVQLSSAGTKLRSELTVAAVTRDGAPEPFRTERMGNFIRIWIGDSNRLLAPGAHRYTIAYRMDRMARSFPDHDELFWNATGNYWIFPIRRATARVTLPEGAVISGVVGYTGPAGSTEQAVTITRISDNSASFRADRPLGAGEGMSVAVSFQKGVLVAPEGIDALLLWLSDMREIILPILGVVLVLAYNVSAWNRVGRDPPQGTIIPLFHPPRDFSPALTHYVHYWGFRDWTAFTATLFDLGVKGLVRIDNPESGLAVTATGTAPPKTLPTGERTLFDYLRGQGVVTVDKTNGVELARQRAALHAAIERENRRVWFNHNFGYAALGLLLALATLGAMVWFEALEPAWLAIGVVAGIVLGVVGAFTTGLWKGGGFRPFFVLLWLGVVGFNVVGGSLEIFSPVSINTAAIAAASIVLITVVFAILMRAPTIQGRKVMDQIEGFKLYLETAEKNRLNISGAPPMTVERFERILPYAIALGVEKPWAEHFDAELARHAVSDVDRGASYRPHWYAGGSGFSPGRISAAVSAASAGMTAAMVAAQPVQASSSGFSGGGGGGGSSGGGGGGGGGGGW